MRQTLFSIQIAQAIGQINPVPRLFNGVARQAPLKLAFENAAGVIGADFCERPYVNDEMCPSAQAFFNGSKLAAGK